MDDFMNDFAVEAKRRADYYVRINCKEGLFQLKERTPNGDMQVTNSVSKIGGILENSVLEEVEQQNGDKKHYFRMFLRSQRTDKLVMAYGPINKAILDLINRMAGPVDPFGKEVVVSIWRVELTNGSTANFAMYTQGERQDWKFGVDAMQKIKGAVESEWVRFFEEFVKPRAEAHQATLQPFESGEPASSNNTEGMASDDDDLPF